MWIGKQMFDQRFYYDRQAKNLNFVFIVDYLEILELGANWTNFFMYLQNLCDRRMTSRLQKYLSLPILGSKKFPSECI